MSGVTTVALAGLLAAIFFFIVAALVYQEAKRRSSGPIEPVYVVEDAVAFIHERLDSELAARLRRSDIRRIIEWEVYYLQGLAQRRRRTPVEVTAGGAPAAVEYIMDQIALRHGVSYPRDDVVAVLALEAEYLAAIGAVGEPVGGEG